MINWKRYVIIFGKYLIKTILQSTESPATIGTRYIDIRRTGVVVKGGDSQSEGY